MTDDVARHGGVNVSQLNNVCTGDVFSKLMPKKKHFSKGLYTFDIGQNDLTSGYFLNMSTDQVRAYVPDVIHQFKTVIQVIAQYVDNPSTGDQGGGGRAESKRSSTNIIDADVVTIGEALEVAALSAGDKPVDESDAAAIQAAEVRATGLGHVVPGGVGAEAQHAAAINARTTRDEHKTKLSDVLTDATSKLKDDKPVTKEDAEIRNNPELATHPGGVAASIAAAANLNKV